MDSNNKKDLTMYMYVFTLHSSAVQCVVFTEILLKRTL